MVARRRPRAIRLTRHSLYEVCVQNPPMAVSLLRAIHGAGPRILGEDFSGTAAVSGAWCRAITNAAAIAVDHDPTAAALARRRKGVRVIEGDVIASTRAPRDACDVMFVGNFSIGEFHARATLVRYLTHARARLRPRAVFVCDTYGGCNAMSHGSLRRERTLDDGRRVMYTWEQRHADPVTAMVENAIHFRVLRGRDVELELADAFVYRWRLWSIPELRDAMRDAGYRATEVYAQLPGAVDQHGTPYARPVEDPAELGDNFAACVVGRI